MFLLQDKNFPGVKPISILKLKATLNFKIYEIILLNIFQSKRCLLHLFLKECRIICSIVGTLQRTEKVKAPFCSDRAVA